MKFFDGQRGKRSSEAEYEQYTHKRCPACGKIKSVTLFYRKTTRTARGWAWDSHCIECRRASCRDYGAATKPLRNERLRAWRRANPNAAKRLDKRRHLRAAYGISEDDVERMHEHQDGCCAICERKTKRLLVDHCHTKGHVRALLCQTCNTFLGWYEKKADTIMRFQKYLATHQR